jgi:hypothetical protein
MLYSCTVAIFLTAALAHAVTLPIRDVRPHEIKDSGYIGRAGGISADVYWLDNNRLIFIGAKPGEYVEPSVGIRFRKYDLHVWNVNAKAVTRHHEGSLYASVCVFKGNIRFEFDKNGSRYILEGEFGRETIRQLDEEAAEERRKHERLVNRITCREYRRTAMPSLGHQVEPLLEGEFASQDRQPRNGGVGHWKYWPRKGSPVTVDMTTDVIGIERYSEYLDSYVVHRYTRGQVFGDTVTHRWWLMDRNGVARDFSPPTGAWMRGSTFVAPTKRGLFMISHAVQGSGNGAAGGYLFERGELKRIIEGLPTTFDVSPDGCRVALAISEWRRDINVMPSVKVIELCSQGQ